MERETVLCAIAGSPRNRKNTSSSSLCSLCGDPGFPEALLPCQAAGCFRVQHTYCGRYCPEMMDDAGRWRCEWCASKKARRITPHDDGDDFSSSPSPRARDASPPSVTNRALDRWRRLAKRTRLGGKKYRLLADVLCLSERTSTTPTA